MRILCLLPLWFATAAAQPAPPPMGQLIDVGGRRLHLHCTGSGSPVIIVENGGGFSVEWTFVQNQVAKFTRICTYDRAGYAWSDRAAVDDGAEQIVDDLASLLRNARIAPPYVMVGQSLGCLWVRAFARRHRDWVVGMIFVDGSHDEDVGFPVDGKRVPLSVLPRAQLTKAHDAYLRAVPPFKPGLPGAPPFDRLPPQLQLTRQWAFEKIVREMGWLPNTLAAAESWRREFHALRQQRLSSPHPLGALPLRVLERATRSSETWHVQQVQLAALSSEGKLIRAEASGHMIQIERPELVVWAIRAVMAEIR